MQHTEKFFEMNSKKILRVEYRLFLSLILDQFNIIQNLKLSSLHRIDLLFHKQEVDQALQLNKEMNNHTYLAPTHYCLDVLWCQPIKLIHVVSTSEFHEY